MKDRMPKKYSVDYDLLVSCVDGMSSSLLRGQRCKEPLQGIRATNYKGDFLQYQPTSMSVSMASIAKR